VADGVTVTARNLHADPGGTFPPPAGQYYAVVRVTLHNGGSSSAQYNAFYFSLQAKEDSIMYDPFALDSAVSHTQLGSGTLAPGQTVSGDLAFQVPDADQHFRLYWKPTVFAAQLRVPVLD
jgi:Domain of unknown function (DUF4352)